jgi:hypothetical protein
MKRETAHLTIVLGGPARAGQLRRALEAHGVEHAAVVAGVSSIRRSLVRGENDCVVMCIALDEPTLDRHGEDLRRLLADHGCFPTALRTVGLLGRLGLNRQAAELGCNVYVDDSARAAQVIRLLKDDASPARARAAVRPTAAAPASRWSVCSRWKFGSPELPADLATLTGVDPAADVGRSLKQAFPPDPVEGSGVEFGGRLGPL